MTRKIDLNDIRLLMQVVECGSYSAAARTTGVPKSTISQRIAGLEATIGTGLLRRTSRSFSLTEAGCQLLPHARAVEDLARQVEIAMFEQGRELQGTLRIACPHAITQFALSPIVPRFLAQHGRVTIKVETTNRPVELVSEGFDMTVQCHLGPLKDSILIQRVVARTPWAVAASPCWVKAHGAPAEPADVPRAQTLCLSSYPISESWSFSRDGENRSVEVAPRLINDDMISLRASATAGGGVAYLPAYLLRSAFESGELIRLLPGWLGEVSTISVLTPPRAQSSRLARAFSDFLAAELPDLVRA